MSRARSEVQGLASLSRRCGGHSRVRLTNAGAPFVCATSIQIRSSLGMMRTFNCEDRTLLKLFLLCSGPFLSLSSSHLCHNPPPPMSTGQAQLDATHTAQRAPGSSLNTTEHTKSVTIIPGESFATPFLPPTLLHPQTGLRSCSTHPLAQATIDHPHCLRASMLRKPLQRRYN